MTNTSARDQGSKALLAQLRRLEPFKIHGEVSACKGASLICSGLHHFLSIGDICTVERRRRNKDSKTDCSAGTDHLLAEVMALSEQGAILLPSRSWTVSASVPR